MKKVYTYTYKVKDLLSEKDLKVLQELKDKINKGKENDKSRN